MVSKSKYITIKLFYKISEKAIELFKYLADNQIEYSLEMAIYKDTFNIEYDFQKILDRSKF
jgi:hypothetical protein